MAKYTINYACGHGSHVEQLYGKNSERERRIEWEECNRVCPECYKAQKLAEDAAAPMKASIRVMCNGMAVSLRVTVTGHTMANKEALAAVGITRIQASGGFMDMLSSSGPKWICGAEVRVHSPEELGDKGKAFADALTTLGYAVTADLDPMSVDTALAIEVFRKQARAAEEKATREATDPRPPNSPLRERIAELEKATGAKWNGKIYGRKGCWNFYVNNVRHDATDAEVAEREENLKLHTAWKARNP